MDIGREVVISYTIFRDVARTLRFTRSAIWQQVSA